VKSFSPIAFIGYSPNVLVVSPSLPFKTSAELIAAAKARPGFYTFASNGSGTLSHLTGELFKQAAGVELLPHRRWLTYWAVNSPSPLSPWSPGFP
jgi:tripartite-type tricarboxylate transporter receptor subunit TctC